MSWEGYGFDGIIAIGASTGGTQAVRHIVSNLPRVMPPVLIVVHMMKGITNVFVDDLKSVSKLDVVLASDGLLCEKNKVYIAPDGRHMTVVRGHDGKIHICCNETERFNGHLPSVDKLFFSVAENCKSRSIGVILTGMGSDGAEGLLKMRHNGHITIGQDEKSSVVYGMPAKAFEIGAVSAQYSLDEMVPSILKLIAYRKS